MLTASELASLRTDFDVTFLNGTCTRLQKTTARSTTGGTVNSYASAESFRARFEPSARDPQEPLTGGAARSVTKWRCWYDPDAVLVVGDRCTDGSRTFHVTGILSPQTETLIGVAELELVEGS